MRIRIDTHFGQTSKLRLYVSNSKHSGRFYNYSLIFLVLNTKIARVLKRYFLIKRFKDGKIKRDNKDPRN